MQMWVRMGLCCLWHTSNEAQVETWHYMVSSPESLHFFAIALSTSAFTLVAWLTAWLMFYIHFNDLLLKSCDHYFDSIIQWFLQHPFTILGSQTSLIPTIWLMIPLFVVYFDQLKKVSWPAFGCMQHSKASPIHNPYSQLLIIFNRGNL